ncbi:hypothetical protein P2318_11585 [Myxococcaceae bacterium GXIMD 01537]
MEEKRLAPKKAPNPVANEIPDPPPEENNLTSPTTGGTAQTAMRARAGQQEIPDPPPEENN